MAVLNGRLPGVLLHPIRWARGHRARKGAARALTALGHRFRKDRGRFPTINSSYRSIAGQWTMWRRYGASRAAVPGYSNHGNGKAVDLGGLGGFGGRDYKWMRRHGPHFGWNNPPRYRSNGAKPESWHFEYSRKGDESRHVESLQRLLRRTHYRGRKDYRGKVDRLWLDGTQAAVGKFMDRLRAGRTSKRNRKQLQRILKRAGCYHGRIDGKFKKLSWAGWWKFRWRYYSGGK